jgi:hypothetical protein
MSDLTFIEKRKLEQTFGMGSGYVLDFVNRTFAEFFTDYMGVDIYNPRYDNGSNSKANRMRAFWQKEDNPTVGKLINHLIDYSERDGALEAASRLIALRLLSGNVPSHTVTSSPAKAPAPENAVSVQRSVSKELAKLREQFSSLAVEIDRKKAGLALEQLLNRLFAISLLKPRLPFRVVGEQIDGSFELDGEIYLLESKWEKDRLPEAPLLVFRGKIEGKSAFTRGVFIALNDISLPARDAITRGKSPLFFVVNGHDLMMILSEAITLTDFLRKRFRLLAEEGRVCVPFAELL